MCRAFAENLEGELQYLFEYFLVGRRQCSSKSGQFEIRRLEVFAVFVSKSARDCRRICVIIEA
jgi:hypothetical protein